MVFKGANKVILSFVEVVVCTASHGMTSATAATAAAAVCRAGIREGKGKPRKAIHRTGLSPRPGLQDQGCNSLHSNAVKYVKCYQFHQSSSKLYISLGQNMAKKKLSGKIGSHVKFLLSFHHCSINLSEFSRKVLRIPGGKAREAAWPPRCCHAPRSKLGTKRDLTGTK